MELKDRIFNIKLLLKFCRISPRDGLITDARVVAFFTWLINDDGRFRHTTHTASPVYPIFKLNTLLNADYCTYSYSIGFEYVYDIHQEEYEMECFFFDSDLEDAVERPMVLSHVVLEYSEIPDNIWEIIQNELYRSAMYRINYRMSSERLSPEDINNEIRDFAEELRRKEEETNL